MAYGWALAYGLTGLCVVPAVLGALYAGPGNFVERHGRVAGQRVSTWLRQTVVNPFREFLNRDGGRCAVNLVICCGLQSG